jgi:hypothetical protein
MGGCPQLLSRSPECLVLGKLCVPFGKLSLFFKNEVNC